MNSSAKSARLRYDAIRKPVRASSTGLWLGWGRKPPFLDSGRHPMWTTEPLKEVSKWLQTICRSVW